MTVVVLVVVVWLLFVWRVSAIVRSGQYVFSRAFELFSVAGVSAVLAAVVVVELSGNRGLPWIWVQIILTGLVVTLFMARYLHMYHTGRYVLSFWLDFVKYCCAMAALVWLLLVFSRRLFDIAPFAGLVVGVLSFFIPVNSAGEVFHRGMSRQTPHHTSRD
jgi:hypothetical protein